jgi:antitoxin VapB
VHGRIALVATMNIKDPEVRRLARALAERRHTSMTGAVRQALQEALDREVPQSREGLSERLLELGRRARAKADAAGWVFLTDDDLYDEQGLPR